MTNIVNNLGIIIYATLIYMTPLTYAATISPENRLTIRLFVAQLRT